MEKINFINNVTKANADTFNTMQDNIENGIADGVSEAKDYADELNTYSTNFYTSNGITLRFEKIGRVVVCTFEGTTTSSLTADTNYSVQIDAKYTPKEVVRNCVVFNELGVIGYIYIPIGTTLQYRVKSNVGTSQYPRFSFTYISNN